MVNETNSDHIMVPAPTAWPFLTAFGIALIFLGLVTHGFVSIVGAVVLLRSAIGWWFDVLPKEQEECVPVSAEEWAGSPVKKSLSSINHLAPGVGKHRVRIPVEVHPVWVGLYGGLAGAVAMAIVAMLFGLIAQRSIWYPINLLAASLLPSLAEAPIDRLTQFSSAGFFAGSVVHVSTSLFVGLLYSVMLPMFPRGAKWRSGFVTPLLWTGLVAASLSVINPTLNARIDWVWFVLSQFAFGVTCGWVVAHTEKIETMQSWPLADRAGIEGIGKRDGGPEQ